MKAQIDSWSLVLLGSWNTAILTPAWLTKLLGSGTVQVEFPIGNPLMPVRYTIHGVHLVVTQDRLMLGPSADDPAVLAQLESFSRKILSTLTHTPVSAVGINFQFVEDEPSDDLKKVFRAPDVRKIADAGLVVEATNLTRQLRLSADDLLNLSLQQTGSQVVIHLNFHHAVDSSTAAALYLEGRVLKYRERALSFLSGAYALELGE